MTKEFNKDGLRHSMQELKAIGHKVAFLPIDEMAEYVDSVTKKMVDENDEDFILKICHLQPDRIFLSALNATSFGNTAYIQLHCKHRPAREIAEQIIERARNFFDPRNQ